MGGVFGNVGAVRATIVMFAAMGVFVWVLWSTHHDARTLLDKERAALARLRAIAREDVDATPLVDGYRYFQEGLFWVAAPEVRGDDGVRWFVTRDGSDVYEYDTILFPEPPSGPDVKVLVSYLELDPKARETAKTPFGWRPLFEAGGPG